MRINTLPDILRVHARERADKSALVYPVDGRSWTFAELDQQSNQVAAALAEVGVGPARPDRVSRQKYAGVFSVSLRWCEARRRHRRGQLAPRGARDGVHPQSQRSESAADRGRVPRPSREDETRNRAPDRRDRRCVRHGLPHVRAVDLRTSERRSARRNRSARDLLSAVHVRHDRLAERRRTDAPQLPVSVQRRPQHLSDVRRHREPRLHAAVSHRGQRLGHRRSVPGRADDPAARRRRRADPASSFRRSA